MSEQTRGTRPSGGVLVGGRSLRMGRPKTMIEHGGKTFAETVVDALAPHVHQVYLIGEGPVPDSLQTMPRILDAPDTEGPLAGLIAALRVTPGRAWVFAPCDLPLISPAAVEWLIEQRSDRALAVLPRVPSESGAEQIEPLFALYEACALTVLEEIAHSSQSAPRRMAADPRVAQPSPPACLCPAWHNVNRPEDLPPNAR